MLSAPAAAPGVLDLIVGFLQTLHALLNTLSNFVNLNWENQNHKQG